MPEPKHLGLDNGTPWAYFSAVRDIVPERSTRPPYTIEAVENALRLLLMLRGRTQLRVTEVSDELGVARSTAHRLLSTVAHYGFVRHDAVNRVYRPGPVLVELALASAGHSDIRQLAKPHLERLAAALHETVNLVVLEGGDVRFIDGVESDQPVRVTLRTGTRFPAHSTSSGKVLLAALPRDRVRALYPEGPGRVTEHTISDMTRLEAELDAVRRNGYATNMDENEIGLHAVAVAITDRAGTAVAAVVVAAPAARLGPMQIPDLVTALKASATAIGTRLPVS